MKTILTLAVLLTAALPAAADNFKSASECVIGKRVANGSNDTGKIVKVDATMCQVKLDNGKETWALFWMLRSEGAGTETDDKLLIGTYACYASGNYTFMDIRITGANAYATDGGAGKFHVEPSRKLVFESGPLSRNFAKLTRGPNIDINTDGGSFYGTTCSYQKK